jgi:hypothetical protein
MRCALPLLLLAAFAGRAAPAGEPDADGYFDLGLEYLVRGQYAQARRAFAEALVRAPGQPVPMALCGVACTAEGRPLAEGARLLRWAYDRVPAGKRLVLPLHELLPSARALAALAAEQRRGLDGARATERLERLTILAFLEVQDADPAKAPALDALLAESPDDRYAKALDAGRAPVRAPARAPARAPESAPESA